MYIREFPLNTMFSMIVANSVGILRFIDGIMDKHTCIYEHFIGWLFFKRRHTLSKVQSKLWCERGCCIMCYRSLDVKVWKVTPFLVEWGKIRQEITRKSAFSMPSRLSAVVDAKGGHTTPY